MTQTVNVASAATAIDGGAVTYNLSGWLGGWTTYAGYTTVTATFLNAAGTPIGTAASLPTVTAANRGNKTGFLARSATGPVPKLTRGIRVTGRIRQQQWRVRLRGQPLPDAVDRGHRPDADAARHRRCRPSTTCSS